MQGRPTQTHTCRPLQDDQPINRVVITRLLRSVSSAEALGVAQFAAANPVPPHHPTTPPQTLHCSTRVGRQGSTLMQTGTA